MPGLNVIVDFNSKLDARQKLIENALCKMDYDSTYSHMSLYSNPNVGVYFSGYEAYPHIKIRLGDRFLVIEGAIYNKSDEKIKAELTDILPKIVQNSKEINLLTNFIRDTDGEFIIYYVDPAISTILVFNDAMGRLPAYCYYDKNRFVVGRSMKFLRGCVPEIEFSEWGLIEYFLYSAPLGDHTVFKNVTRLLPYTMFTVDYAKGLVEKKILFQYNFDDRWEDKPAMNYVADLHDLFIDSVSTRAARFKDKKHILSLSGGLDSRTNLMGLLKTGIEFETITFNDYYNQLGRDVPVVKQLVNAYKIKNKTFRLVAENIPDVDRLVFLKDGSGLMGTMGSTLNSMEITEREFGRAIVYYVGDEGNYTTAPRYSGRPIKSIPDFVNMIFAKNSLSAYSIGEAAALFGKKPREIFDYLCDYYSGYPETDNTHKIDRFFIWERSFKFTMENQDKVRLFFWPLAPHYGIKYAPYAFKIKNSYLANWKIYIELLRSLDKYSVKIKYANFGIPLDSPLLSYYLYVRGHATRSEMLRKNLLVVLRLLRNPVGIIRKREEYGYVDEVRDHIKDLANHNKQIGSLISVDNLNSILAGEKYIYKMYVAANMIKFIDLVQNKTI
jgi:hypothetical protein